MADRMRVTSLIGDTERARGSAGQALPNPWSGLRNLLPADASDLLTRQVVSETEEAISECTSRLAASPRLFRHADRHGPASRKETGNVLHQGWLTCALGNPPRPSLNPRHPGRTSP